MIVDRFINGHFIHFAITLSWIKERTGNAAIITFSPFESVRTMTATVVAEMGEASYGSVHYRALFWVGIVLLLMTFALNFVAQRVLKKYQRA